MVMALYTEDPLSGEGLVWGSEVNIEIDPQDNSKRTSILDPSVFARQSTETASIEFPQYSNPSRIGTLHHLERCRPDTAFSIAEDADDEGSLYVKSPPPSDNLQPHTDVRGRPRSRTKQLRRRGIDLSRDELRISSRWSSGEKRSMENFRDAIRDKAKDHGGDEMLFGKWSAKRGRPFFQEARAIKEKVTNGFRTSISRNRGRRKDRAVVEGVQAARCKGIASFNADQPVKDAILKHAEPKTLRQVQSSVSIRKQSPSPLSSDEDPSLTTKLRLPHRNENPQNTSWQQHLQHDLAPSRGLRYKKARYLLQEDLKEKKEAEERNRDRRILPSDYFPDHISHKSRSGSAAQPLLQPSSSMSAISHRHIEEYWRLPSLASTNVALSPSSSHSRLERLDQIASSGDYEDAWWKDNGRNGSTSSRTPSNIPRSPTTELLAALKARVEHARKDIGIGNEQDTSLRPLLQPSASASASYFSRPDLLLTPPATADFKRLVSSMSLPEGMDVASRYSSYQDGQNRGIGGDIVDETQKLAVHPLTTRLPYKNLVRPSMSMTLRSNGYE